MRVVIQRVLNASVSISGTVTAAIGEGLLVLLGICEEDGDEDIEWLVKKIVAKKGNRPSYIRAARPEVAIPLYERFCAALSAALGKPVPTGTFGADMQVALVNDGPVTICIDTKNKE